MHTAINNKSELVLAIREADEVNILELLKIAIQKNYLDIVEESIQNYPYIVSSYDDRGRTLLHEAARNGNYNIVILLIKAGASISQADNAGRTALSDAQVNNDNDIVNLLVATLLGETEENQRSSIDESEENQRPSKKPRLTCTF